MKINTEPVRGTNDYLPKETRIREYVRSTILKTYTKYGFNQIMTPIMEDINTLLGSDGGDNVKLVFKILKRGDKLDLTKNNLTAGDIVDLGLRYDLTVPLVRCYSNNQAKLTMPFKSIQIDYSFRAERPQRGRFRQFIQCDIDILGDSSPNAEIDLLNTSAHAYMDLGFKNFTIKISDRRVLLDLLNSIGFNKEDFNDICVIIDKIDKVGLTGVKEELISAGYNNKLVEKLCFIIEDVLKNGINSLPAYGVRSEVVDSLNYIIDSVRKLSNKKYNIVFDISIVRGQNYYTGTVYEFYMEGFRGACGGGGRYDNMIEKMIGKSIPAVGFSIGFEPTCMLIQENSMLKLEKDIIAVIYRENDNFVDVLKFVEDLSKNSQASAIPMRKNLNFQLQNLKDNGYTKFVIFDRKEIKSL